MNARALLVPVNGDSACESAFRLACRLVRANKAKLQALHIIEVKHELPLDAEVDASQGEGVLDRIERLSHEEKYQVEAQYLQARRAGPAIVQEASERGTELIVVGIPYKHRMGRFTVGETASYLLQNAPCPVILWREENVSQSRHTRPPGA